MADFPVEIWVGLGAIAGTGVLGFLHALACIVRNEAFVHDTKIRVANLRQKYARQLAAAEQGEVMEDVIILPDPPTGTAGAVAKQVA
jgi:hypothetical protein